MRARFRIDDPVGAVAVHGMVGVWSLLACGIFLAGTPSAVGGPDISILGQVASIGVFAALGFIPGYLCAGALKLAGLLRSPPEVEILGLDLSEIPAAPYPEGIPATALAPRFVPVSGLGLGQASRTATKASSSYASFSTASASSSVTPGRARMRQVAMSPRASGAR